MKSQPPPPTPVKGDVGNHLRVTVTYTDGEGPGESVLAMSDNPVEALPQPEPTPVTPVPGATPVMPSKGTVITSLNGYAAVSFPTNSMVTPFQVRLDGEADNCTADDITGSVVQACVIVEFFEVTGNPEEDAVLDVAATLTFGLGASKMEDLGGQSALSQDIDEGNVRLLIRYGPAGPWSDVSFGIRPDGGRGARFTATIQRPGEFALVTPAPEPTPALAALPTPTPIVAPTLTPESEPPSDEGRVSAWLIVLTTVGFLVIVDGGAFVVIIKRCLP